jgi:hypothetical protein
MLLDERSKSSKRFEGEGEGAYRAKRRIDEFSQHNIPGTDYASLLPILETSTAPLRHAAIDALQESIDLLNTLNHSRWTSPKSSTPINVREQHLARLREALQEFKAQDQFKVLANFSELFDPKTGEPRKDITAMTHASRNLFRCQVFTTTLSGFSDVLVEWLEMLLDIERNNPKSAFQFPGGTGTTKAVMEAANDKEGGGNPMEMGGDNQADDASLTSTLVDGKSDKEGKKRVRRSYGKSPSISERKTADQLAKDPDAGDPTNAFQKLGRGLHAMWKGVSSPEGIFALKYALVSIALWVPAVAPTSAQFTYENR